MSGIRSALTSALTGVAQTFKPKVAADSEAFPCLDVDTVTSEMESMAINAARIPSSAPTHVGADQVSPRELTLAVGRGPGPVADTPFPITIPPNTHV